MVINYTDIKSDTHILLKKCSENKICQQTLDYSMDFWIYNIKELTAEHYCYYTSECSTLIPYLFLIRPNPKLKFSIFKALF